MTREFEMISPESAGLPSGAVTEFLNELYERRLCIHGFLMLRGGKILAEGYAPPFHKDRPHRMYSVSKTFAAAGVGLMIGEGKLSLSDRAADFFPEHLDGEPHPLVAAATVRDLLMMATPYSSNTYGERDKNWVKTFFDRPPSHAPGTVFSYSTSATVVLTAIVEKLAGTELMEYMYPRLLGPIGFSPEVRCVRRPEGGAWAGSGVLCTPRELAAFALVFLNGGRHEGVQLLPEDFVLEATSKQISTRTGDSGTESRYGYGYQIWRLRNNGFAMIGMGGQYAVCLPDRDFVLVTTGDTQLVNGGASHILEALWSHVYPRIRDCLPEDPAALNALRGACESLALPVQDGERSAPVQAEIGGRVYRLAENSMGIKWLSFGFENGAARLKYENKTGEHELVLGLGGYAKGVFPETHYYGEQIGVPLGRGYEYHAGAAWEGPRTLAGTVYITDDYLGAFKFQFTFGENDISILFSKAAEWFLNEYSGFGYGTAE